MSIVRNNMQNKKRIILLSYYSKYLIEKINNRTSFYAFSYFFKCCLVKTYKKKIGHTKRYFDVSEKCYHSLYSFLLISLLSDFHACFALLSDPGGDFPDAGLDGDNRDADPDET